MMHELHDGLPVVAFEDRAGLWDWLARQPGEQRGVWVRLARSGSGIPSVRFHDLLEAGLCFGWSESTRHAGDDRTYLQRFAPRRSRGTASERNRRLVARLASEGLMTPAGWTALGLEAAPD